MKNMNLIIHFLPMKNKIFFTFLLLFFSIFLNVEIQANETGNLRVIQKKVNEISNNIRCFFKSLSLDQAVP